MSTINISLPSQQVSIIDSFVSRFGFANRSEFIRSLVRLATQKPNMVAQASTFPFVAPKERSAKKIIEDFTKTKKYSKGFLKDLKEGLKTSDYFDQRKRQLKSSPSPSIIGSWI